MSKTEEEEKEEEEVVIEEPTSYATSYIPPGLENLTYVDMLFVKHKVEIIEVLTGYETFNQYTVQNMMGQNVYYAAEKSGFLMRNCCGNLRQFDMILMDNYGKQVMELHRPLRCQFPCGLQSMYVMAPIGTLIGSIEQKWHCAPRYSIRNGAGDELFLIRRPFCTTCACCGDVEFNVLSARDESEIGKISKKWGGVVREALTDADIFGIEFPVDLDVYMKAVLLGACFLIDYMYFEGTTTIFNSF